MLTLWATFVISCTRDIVKAIRTAFNKNIHVLEEMWDTESDMETDEGSESEDEEGQNDDSDSDEPEEA